MRGRFGSVRARLLMVASLSALGAVFLLLADPFASDVLGQTGAPGAVPPSGQVVVNGVTVINTGDQPANIQASGNEITIAVPAGFTIDVQGASCASVGGATNVVTCTVPTGGRLTFTAVAGVQRQPAAPAAPSNAPAVAPAQAAPRVAVAPAQAAPLPAALPRTGTGAADAGMSGATVAAFGLLAFAAALAAGSLLLRRRRRA
jgi:hypothetical protein